MATICEMMFAGHVGVNIALDELIKTSGQNDYVPALFAEELGAVIQVRAADLSAVLEILQQYQLQEWSHVLGELNDQDELKISCRDQIIYQQSRRQLQQWWAETSYRLQALRDNPACANAEYEELAADNPGLSVKLSFDPAQDVCAPFMQVDAPPRVAILREQGVNGQMEMAAAFSHAGFVCVDVHMTDLFSGKIKLDDFVGLAACGGFFLR